MPGDTHTEQGGERGRQDKALLEYGTLCLNGSYKNNISSRVDSDAGGDKLTNKSKWKHHHGWAHQKRSSIIVKSMIYRMRSMRKKFTRHSMGLSQGRGYFFANWKPVEYRCSLLSHKGRMMPSKRFCMRNIHKLGVWGMKLDESFFNINTRKAPLKTPKFPPSSLVLKLKCEKHWVSNHRHASKHQHLSNATLCLLKKCILTLPQLHLCVCAFIFHCISGCVSST